MNDNECPKCGYELWDPAAELTDAEKAALIAQALKQECGRPPLKA